MLQKGNGWPHHWLVQIFCGMGRLISVWHNNLKRAKKKNNYDISMTSVPQSTTQRTLHNLKRLYNSRVIRMHDWQIVRYVILSLVKKYILCYISFFMFFHIYIYIYSCFFFSHNFLIKSQNLFLYTFCTSVSLLFALFRFLYTI